ncbi:MAG: hypothetical protein GF401_06425 [Chitinivibrionales bacterium]|nr:hypothetical protein [Chitinivibrionales bacterium]
MKGTIVLCTAILGVFILLMNCGDDDGNPAKASPTTTDTAIVNTGAWTSTTDSVFLHSEVCAVYDTTSGVDSLVYGPCPTEPSGVPININATTGLWSIRITDLAPIAEAFGIDVSDPMFGYISLTFSKTHTPQSSTALPEFVGTWQDTFPAMGDIVPRDVYMYVNFEIDSSYQIYAWYKGE